MLRKNVRLRKEYLYRKSLEQKERSILERKRRLKEAFDEGRAIPTELRGEERKLRKGLDLEDNRTKINVHSHVDDEYAFAGVRQPRAMITTCRDSSSRLIRFAKEMRLMIPFSQTINRGGYVMKDLINICKSHEVTDLIVVHEHRGDPDGLIICHLPFGPTAYFSLMDVVMRHDLPEKPATISEVHPHLIFHNFTSRLGARVESILKYLFPPANPLGRRVLTFGNYNDVIHFRHHMWSDDSDRRKQRGQLEEEEEEEGKTKTKGIELTEIGPRFAMKLYRIELGTTDMKDVEIEWTLRPFMNKSKAALTE